MNKKNMIASIVLLAFFLFWFFKVKIFLNLIRLTLDILTGPSQIIVNIIADRISADQAIFVNVLISFPLFLLITFLVLTLIKDENTIPK